MPKRHPNHRLVKRHRNYTIEEIATLFGTHRNTVRNWLKKGLRTIDDRRPLLILGSVLSEYLASRRARSKRPCAPGEIYCLPCRSPRAPLNNLVVYQSLTHDRGNLVGVCPACGRRLFRRVSQATLAASVGELEVRFTDAEEHISERPHPSVNCDF
ncbi:helix-turn-helix domain-containing protein [Luteimonas mephitis]|uniref:helix-turn-helix domain-containing protein n=1 Tax=Luteimonas mephitis TaxID=83615 RepID=UPI003A8E0796